jgi:predicted CopG family antitoxin
MPEYATITVRAETADRVHALKRRTDSYDDVVRELLDAVDGEDRVNA